VRLVRGYATWALGRIGGGKARSVLDSQMKIETSDFVIAEIKAALAGRNTIEATAPVLFICLSQGDTLL
jgi:hypothetical protein